MHALTLQAYNEHKAKAPLDDDATEVSPKKGLVSNGLRNVQQCSDKSMKEEAKS